MNEALRPGAAAVGAGSVAWEAWSGSPWPLLGLDGRFRIVHANAAAVSLLAWPLERLIGRDLLSFEAPAEQAAQAAAWAAAADMLRQGQVPQPLQIRCQDGEGRARWLLGRLAVAGGASDPLWTLALQDIGVEVQAREQARWAHEELGLWFDLSREGLLVYDETGLVVRCNSAAEQLLEVVPPFVHEAPPALQALLGWVQGRPLPQLKAGLPPVETEAQVPATPGTSGRTRRLAARLAVQGGRSGPLRVLAALQDRTLEDDAHLMRLEMGLLRDTAAGSVATYDPRQGWLGGHDRPRATIHARTAPSSPVAPPAAEAAPAAPAAPAVGPAAPGSARGPQGTVLRPSARATAPALTRASGASPGSSATPGLPQGEVGGAAAAATAGSTTGSIGPAGRAASETAARSTKGGRLDIGRSLVDPASMADYDRLQQALRQGERSQVRYAVRHPEMGQRWLMTRVEPGALADGQRTMSVVTLDVTEAESAQRRSAELLHELDVILNSSTAGIAYLRGPQLVRSNQRFERMLGFPAGAAQGASLAEVFSRSMGELQGAPYAAQALLALEEGRAFEAELPLSRGDGPPQWYSLSVRRAADGPSSPQGQAEAVAVLTDITRLKQQQGELQQLLRDRELMFNLSEVGIVYQRGARIERANQAMADLTGWASTEMHNLDIAALYEDARSCVEFENRIAQGLRAHRRFSGERRLRRRDGRVIWVQVSVRPAQEGDGGDFHGGIVCSFVDVDDRQRARESLARQADRTRAILNSVLVGIVTVSAHGIQWMNRSARRMFAGELADFVGEPMSIVATDEAEHPLRRTDYLDRLNEGQSENFECRLRGRDGREFWVVGNAVATGQGPGGPELTIALLDIERRRQAEVRIAQAQASLQRVIETAPLAIVLFDAGTLRLQQLNQTAALFMGRPLDLLAGAELDAATAPLRAATLRVWLTHAAETGQAGQHEWRDEDEAGAAEGEGGAQRVWDCRIALLADPLGGPGQLLLVASDVTSQRAAERERLAAAIAQREVLVREVHHRIKNNLQGVAGLLQQSVVRHPELSHTLSEAIGQVQAIAQVYGLQVGASGPLEVASLLSAIAQSVQRTFGRTIAVHVPAPVPHLLPEAEAIPIALTINELLTNAIKHSAGSQVECTLVREGEGVEVRIASVSRLPPDFDITRVRGGVSGLSLVRALLPRRSAALALEQQGPQVVARVTLHPPSVLDPATLPRLAPQSGA